MCSFVAWRVASQVGLQTFGGLLVILRLLSSATDTVVERSFYNVSRPSHDRSPL
jgi:hypothetical protein